MTTAIEHLHVNANGINFRVAVSGPENGPAILCLHGFPEGSMGWRPFMEAMPQARIYAPDLRGYPAPINRAHGYDVFTLTDDVKALIEALKLDRPMLLTHDWGGAIGWIFAHRYSPLIRQARSCELHSSKNTRARCISRHRLATISHSVGTVL